jgi:hypothetical protein
LFLFLYFGSKAKTAPFGPTPYISKNDGVKKHTLVLGEKLAGAA